MNHLKDTSCLLLQDHKENKDVWQPSKYCTLMKGMNRPTVAIINVKQKMGSFTVGERWNKSDIICVYNNI